MMKNEKFYLLFLLMAMNVFFTSDISLLNLKNKLSNWQLSLRPRYASLRVPGREFMRNRCVFVNTCTAAGLIIYLLGETIRCRRCMQLQFYYAFLLIFLVVMLYLQHLQRLKLEWKTTFSNNFIIVGQHNTIIINW